ncbi:MAG: winged helix-turn-helix domain-containing protein [Pseudomonadota bacterium]|nr:winged helix-turn-helix domain-containing protein [Pseudomonadota bacterium]
MRPALAASPPSAPSSSLAPTVVPFRPEGVRRVLIIDNDPFVRDVALEQLADPRRRMETADSIGEVDHTKRRDKPDLIIIGAADGPEFDLSSRLRQTFKVPIVPLFRPSIYVRPRQALPERSATLLSALADCRIRIDQHLQAPTPPPGIVANWGGFTVRLEAGAFSIEGQDIGMTRVERAVLSLLMHHAGELISVALIEKAIFCSKPKSQSNYIPVHISRMRAKLRTSRSDIFIENVRGEGYILFWSRSFASIDIPRLEMLAASPTP